MRRRERSGFDFLLGLLLCSSFRFTLSAPPLGSIPVFIDSDNSAGLDGERDIDDALAIIQLFNSPEVFVVGVSSTFGNAATPATTLATQELLDRFYPEYGMKVAQGALAPGFGTTEAVETMARALRRNKKLVVICLGSATNIAATLTKYPEYRTKIGKVVFVGGRSSCPDKARHTVCKHFNVGRKNPQHLPDLNFEKDAAATAALMRFHVPLTLVPFELSAKVKVYQSDINGVNSPQHSTEATQWIANMSTPWIAFWTKTFSVEYFNPFDCLAALYVTHPHLLTCTKMEGWIERLPSDDVLTEVAGHVDVGDPSVHGIGTKTKLYLHTHEEAPDGTHENIVTFCTAANYEAKGVIMERLRGRATLSERREGGARPLHEEL